MTPIKLDQENPEPKKLKRLKLTKTVIIQEEELKEQKKLEEKIKRKEILRKYVENEAELGSDNEKHDDVVKKAKDYDVEDGS